MLRLLFSYRVKHFIGQIPQTYDCQEWIQNAIYDLKHVISINIIAIIVAAVFVVVFIIVVIIIILVINLIVSIALFFNYIRNSKRVAQPAYCDF